MTTAPGKRHKKLTQRRPSIHDSGVRKPSAHASLKAARPQDIQQLPTSHPAIKRRDGKN
jgi:hypothetical protein